MDNTNLDEKKLQDLAMAYFHSGFTKSSHRHEPNSYADGYRQAFADQQKKIEKLKKQLEICLEALSFYANRDNYDTHEVWGKVCVVQTDTDVWPVFLGGKNVDIVIGGKRARQALAELENVK